MTIAIAEISLRSSAYMGEDEAGGGFRRDAGQVYAVPRRDRGGEDAGFGTEGGGGVVADSEAVAVVRAAPVLVEGLLAGGGNNGGRRGRTRRRRESKDWVRME